MHPTNKLLRRKLRQDSQRSEKSFRPKLPTKKMKYPKQIIEHEVLKFSRGQHGKPQLDGLDDVEEQFDF